MSLYEPSVRSSTWSLAGLTRRLSRRFTTLEGWREVGLGVYAMSSNIRMFSLKHQFDAENLRIEAPVQKDRVKSMPAVRASEVPPVPKMPEFVEVEEGEWIRTSKGTVGKAIGSVRDGGFVGGTEKADEGLWHVYSRKEKGTIVAIVGVAGLFPGLTMCIYIPTLTAVSTSFAIGLDQVTLSVTSYFLFQGFASLLWGPLAESLGRRAVYIYSFAMYIVSSITLAFSPNFAVLVVFRGVQAAAIASTVSLGSLVINDISLPSEQDSFYTFSQGIRNWTLVLAPIIGGLLSNYLNFRAVFVFLLGLSIAALIVLLLFLPETHRSIAGSGTLPLRGIHQPLIWRFKVFGKPAHEDEHQLPGIAPRVEVRGFVEPLALLKEKDILLSLLFSGVIFGIWTMVLVSTPGLFRSVFGLNETLLGLVFIPSGLGTILGSTVMGNLLAADFASYSSRYKASRSLPPSTQLSRSSLPAYFPLEHARLVRLPMVVVIFIIALSFYGFTLSYPQLTSLGGWILVPLLLQFIIAATANAVCAIHHSLIADLWPKSPGSAAAVSNLTRCGFAAIGVGVVQQFIRGVDVGPMFLALGLVVLVVVPLPIVQWYWGEEWRRERGQRGMEEGMEGESVNEKV